MTKKLSRSTTDKKIAGICGGLGEYFNIDATLIRLIVVFATLMTAILPGMILYFVAALVIPSTSISFGLKTLRRSTTDKMITGVCGGLGEYLEIDTLFLRGLVVLFTLSTGVVIGVACYFIATLVIAEKP